MGRTRRGEERDEYEGGPDARAERAGAGAGGGVGRVGDQSSRTASGKWDCGCLLCCYACWLAACLPGYGWVRSSIGTGTGTGTGTGDKEGVALHALGWSGRRKGFGANSDGNEGHAPTRTSLVPGGGPSLELQAEQNRPDGRDSFARPSSPRTQYPVQMHQMQEQHLGPAWVDATRRDAT